MVSRGPPPSTVSPPHEDHRPKRKRSIQDISTASGAVHRRTETDVTWDSSRSEESQHLISSQRIRKAGYWSLHSSIT